MPIVYYIYNNIATFEFSGRLKSLAGAGSLTNNPNRLRINPDFWRSKTKSRLLYILMASGDQFRYTSPIPRGSAQGDNGVTFKAQRAGAKWCQFQWPHDR